MRIERESNNGSVVVRKITINDELNCCDDQQSKSPPSPTQGPYNRVPTFGQGTNETKENHEKNYRHSLNPKIMEREILMSAKENLKRTLIGQK